MSRLFFMPYSSQLFAFTVGEKDLEKQAFHIAAAHTDYPCLHLKPTAELAGKGYLRLNTEVYGGPILNTWLDRPLSLAGRVVLRRTNAYEPETVLYCAERPLLTIPNLAVHMNRKVNEGVELKKQSDMLPLFGLAPQEEDAEYFLNFLASELGREKNVILVFDWLSTIQKKALWSVGMKSFSRARGWITILPVTRCLQRLQKGRAQMASM